MSEQTAHVGGEAANAMAEMTAAGAWDGALRLFDTLIAARAVPTEALHAAALDACARSGQWERALQILKDIVAVRGSPNGNQRGAVIAACSSRSGRWAEVLELLEQCHPPCSAPGVPPSPQGGSGLAPSAAQRPENGDSEEAVLVTASAQLMDMVHVWRRAIEMLQGKGLTNHLEVLARVPGVVSPACPAPDTRCAAEFNQTDSPPGAESVTYSTVSPAPQQRQPVQQVTNGCGCGVPPTSSSWTHLGPWQRALCRLESLRMQRQRCQAASAVAAQDVELLGGEVDAVAACAREGQWARAMALLEDARRVASGSNTPATGLAGHTQCTVALNRIP